MPSPLLMALCALLLSFGGFAALSLAMDRHQEEVLGRALAGLHNHALQAAGTGLLVLALLACMVGKTASVAATDWLGLLTLAALAVAALLSYVPRALPPAAGLALLTAATTGLLAL